VGPLNIVMRVLFFGVALSLITPNVLLDIIGFVFLVGYFFFRKVLQKGQGPAEVSSASS